MKCSRRTLMVVILVGIAVLLLATLRSDSISRNLFESNTKLIIYDQTTLTPLPVDLNDEDRTAQSSADWTDTGSDSVSKSKSKLNVKPSISSDQTTHMPVPVDLTDEDSVVIHQTAQSSAEWTDEDRVVHRVEVCLNATNMTSYFEEMGYMDGARDHARKYYREVRTFVPTNFSSEFYSPCWRTNIQVTKGRSNNELRSNVDGVIYNTKMFNDYNFKRIFTKDLHSNFKTTIACLPKVFLIGIAKCGTSYAYCLMTEGLGIQDVSGYKEPHWWLPLQSWTRPQVRDTKPDHVPPYFLYFAKAYSIMEEHAKHPSAGVYYPPVVVNGNPNLLHQWLRTYYKEPPLNYCLKPALVPVFVPSAKYVVILRNPVTFLYSKFQYSCNGEKISGGRDVFHERIIRKIAIFNNCTKKYTLAKCASVDLDELVDESFFTPETRCGKTAIEYAMYYLHIRKWFSVVPREKMFFMTMEEFFDHSSLVNVAKNLWNFYDLPKPYTFNEKHLSQCSHVTNANSYHKNPNLGMRADTELVLKEFYRPFNEKLAELLGDRKYLWEDSL